MILKPSQPLSVKHGARPDSVSAWAVDPRLRDARDLVRERGWAVLRDLPFVAGGRGDEGAALAIASAFGVPSSRDGGTAVRRVAPAPLGDGTTFSSWRGAAGLHTDSQYHSVPEPLVCMFVVRPAASGGLTRLLSADDAIAAVAGRPDGDELLALLAQPIWRWRMPQEFAADPTRPQDSPPTAVLDGEGTIRWRSDNLAPGLPAAQRAAAHVVGRCFDEAAGAIALRLDAGDLVIVDNRRVLHGRTWFADSRRLLLRVRLWESS